MRKTATIFLHDPKAKNAMLVECQFAAIPDGFDKIRTGQRVTITGRCSEANSDGFVLQGCKVDK